MSRERWGLLGLLVAALWFLGPADRVAEGLRQHRAEELRAPSIQEPVLAVLGAAPEDLPRGDEARALARQLEEALALHELQGHWLEGVLGLLDPEQLVFVAENGAGEPLRRRRSHPETPTELLLLLECLQAQVGSVQAELPPRPDKSPLADRPSQDLLRGLLALARAGRIGDEQAPRVIAAALVGVRAHEQTPERVKALVAGLGPGLVQTGQPGLAEVGELSLRGAEAVFVLERRGGL